MCTKRKLVRFPESDALASLHHFNNLLRATIPRCSDDSYAYEVYDGALERSYSSFYSGCYFSVTRSDSFSKVYPGVGVQYDLHTRICLWLDKDWHPEFRGVLSAEPERGEWFTVEEESDALVFWMPGAKYDRFNSSTDTRQQRAILKGFLRACTVCIMACLRDGVGERQRQVARQCA